MRPILDCLVAEPDDIKPILTKPNCRTRYESARGRSLFCKGKVYMCFFLFNLLKERRGERPRGICIGQAQSVEVMMELPRARSSPPASQEGLLPGASKGRAHGVGHPGCLCTTPPHFSTEGKAYARTPTRCCRITSGRDSKRGPCSLLAVVA